jgi:uncharacterized protein (TIGR02145 family)
MKYFASLALVLVGTALHAQTIMNIHQNTGAVVEVPQNSIDSITYSVLYTQGPGVTDGDGNSYPTLLYGNGQEWMAANLRTATYANGDPIPTVGNMTEWCALGTGAWVHYDLDAQYEDPYGKLYNWYTVEDARNVCPTGWHVPSDVEWTALVDFLGGLPVAGGKMKTVGPAYWQNPNVGATNESGFSAVGGSWAKGTVCNFGTLKTEAMWWSSTPFSATYAWYYSLTNTSGQLNRGASDGRNGFSLRCVRD